jgi:hypothetical protein
MVSAVVAVPVVKLLEDAVTVQEALSSARLSVTWTVPSGPEMVLPGAPDPRLAAVGAVNVSSPLVTANVTVVLGSLPARAAPAACAARMTGPPVAADAAAGASATPMTAAALSARPTDFLMNPPDTARRTGPFLWAVTRPFQVLVELSYG